MKSTDKFVLVLVASLALLLAGCGGGSSTPPPDPGPSPAQMAIDDAKAALVEAEAAVSSAMTDVAMAAAYRAIENAANALVAALTTHGGSSAEIAAAARTGGNAKAMADSLDMKNAEAQKAADMAMAATAAKLYAGISAPVANTVSETATIRAAAYNEAGTPTGSAVDTHISVFNGSTTAVSLSEDKMAMIADNHGWAGKRYTASPTGDGMYEAMVYSNVEAPKQGKKFGSADAVPNDNFQYQLDAADRNGNANKALTYVVADHAADVSLPSVTRTAGTETFHLPDPNNGGAQFINVPGMLHGVSGTFSCDPTTDADGCTAAVAAKGFTLGGGTWLFIPSNAEARVTDVPDADYVSYGWWIHKSADGITASAFVDHKGAVPTAASNLDTLQGTATYSGGAAGKYALSSSTGGTNDAGHFTASATLEADFSDNMISGTIDNFMGADGMSRDWSVELKKAAIAATGGITRTDDNDTAWTIGGTAASASGEWSGTLYDNGDDNVPQVGTGTFYTEYGMDGKMVGAFGVNKE